MTSLVDIYMDQESKHFVSLDLWWSRNQNIRDTYCKFWCSL